MIRTIAVLYDLPNQFPWWHRRRWFWFTLPTSWILTRDWRVWTEGRTITVIAVVYYCTDGISSSSSRQRRAVIDGRWSRDADPRTTRCVWCVINNRNIRRIAVTYCETDVSTRINGCRGWSITLPAPHVLVSSRIRAARKQWNATIARITRVARYHV